MLKKSKSALSAIVLFFFIGSFTAHAGLIDFSTALSLGHQPESITVGGIVVSGWTVNKTTGAWSRDGVILNNRRELPNELGLGVCLSSNCPTTGNGDINEIDNDGSTFDVIRLDFGAANFLNAVGLSSLDSGLKDGFAIFGSNTAQPDLTSTTSLIAIASGTNQSIGQIDPIINVNQTFRYFFVTPLNRGANDSSSDFLLASVTTVPEPYTAATLGFGLLAFGAALRLKLRRDARTGKSASFPAPELPPRRAFAKTP